jgi:hypothetical protein
MATTDDLLKQILAAQLAQIALLQSIAANIGMQNRQELGGNFVTNVHWPTAVKALGEAAAQLAPKEKGSTRETLAKLGKQAPQP